MYIYVNIFLELYTFLMHLERYKKEIREPSKNVHFRRKPKAVPYFPLRGFNLDRKIPAASHLCEYMYVNSRNKLSFSLAR